MAASRSCCWAAAAACSSFRRRSVRRCARPGSCSRSWTRAPPAAPTTCSCPRNAASPRRCCRRARLLESFDGDHVSRGVGEPLLQQRTIILRVIPALERGHRREFEQDHALRRPRAFEHFESAAPHQEASAILLDRCRDRAVIALERAVILHIEIHDQISRHACVLPATLLSRMPDANNPLPLCRRGRAIAYGITTEARRRGVRRAKRHSSLLRALRASVVDLSYLRLGGIYDCPAWERTGPAPEDRNPGASVTGPPLRGSWRRSPSSRGGRGRSRRSPAAGSGSRDNRRAPRRRWRGARSALAPADPRRWASSSP